jgi:hypothetical protein
MPDRDQERCVVCGGTPVFSHVYGPQTAGGHGPQAPGGHRDESHDWTAGLCAGHSQNLVLWLFNSWRPLPGRSDAPPIPPHPER